MPGELIDGKRIAAEVRAEVAAEAERLRAETGVTPGLAVVIVGDDPASHVYVRNKDKAAKDAGFHSSTNQLPAETSEAELLALVASFNRDPTIHGILVQLPLPRHIDERKVLAAISPWKDVDGFHPENQGLLLQGTPRFVPATPKGVQELLHRAKVETAGRHAVVLGRSNIVGKPLAALLVAKGPAADCTVTVCHSRTRDLAAVTRSADILVAAIGVPEFVKRDMVKPGAVVIDVGINRVDGRLTGDVAFEEVREVASAITPVPGGVGPMTIAMLLRNTLDSAKRLAALPGGVPGAYDPPA